MEIQRSTRQVRLVTVESLKKRERNIMLKQWLDQAACRGVDTNIFMPLRGENVKVTTAKKICGECPVRQECLDDSLRQAQLLTCLRLLLVISLRVVRHLHILLHLGNH